MNFITVVLGFALFFMVANTIEATPRDHESNLLNKVHEHRQCGYIKPKELEKCEKCCSKYGWSRDQFMTPEYQYCVCYHLIY